MTESRTFQSLRSRTRAPDQEMKIVAAAARKIALMREGQVLLNWMRWLVERPLPTDAPDGALREQNGARRLLAQIEGLIASGKGPDTA